jgi:alkylated DNA repair protein (DNA oxidative demethylase)
MKNRSQHKDRFNGPAAQTSVQLLAPGAVLLRHFASDDAPALCAALRKVLKRSPFRHMITPGGHTMSVAMTNCGALGWVTDRKGYRYDPIDPETANPWPEMPRALLELSVSAAEAAGYHGFTPDACLINRYVPGSRLTLHQDKDERDYKAPIVSVSLGLPAKFLFGGLTRTDKAQRILLHHGDVCVWGGPSRLCYHAIDALKEGYHPLTGRCRINLTFRKVY